MSLLEVYVNQPIEGLTEKLVYGGQMLLIGMATVFSVLMLIWGCLSIFKIVFHDMPKAKKASKTVKDVQTLPPAVASAPSVPSNDEIVAVIAAAIAAAESECSGLKFKVVSFRRK